MKKIISIITPMYNEEENIALCHQRITDIMTSFTEYDYEIIFINDGSVDSSWDLMEAIAKTDTHFKPINFARNFGQQVSTTAGLTFCKGDYAFIIDGDLQHPPELFPTMLEKCVNEGYDSVYVEQHSKKNISFIKKYTSKIFYGFFNFLSSVHIPPNTGDFRIINRKMIDIYLAMPEKHKFIRGQFAWMGFKQCSIPLELPIREHGESKFTFIKSLNLALDGLFSFSFAPVRFIFLITFLMCSLTGLFLFSAIIALFFGQNYFIGFSGIVLLLLALSSIILYSIGIIGEYIIRIYIQSLDRPIFTISDKLNFDKD